MHLQFGDAGTTAAMYLALSAVTALLVSYRAAASFVGVSALLLVVTQVVLGEGWLLASSRSAGQTLLGSLVALLSGGISVAVLTRSRDRQRDRMRRERAEVAVLHERLAGLLAASHDAIVLLDATGRVLEANPAAAALCGLPADEISGADLVDLPLLPPDVRAAELHRMQALSMGGVLEREIDAPRADGAPCLLDLRVRAYRTVDGERRILIAARDISERRAHQEQQAGEQRLESLGLLAGGIAHEFNNELSVVVHHLQFALGQVPDDGPVASDLRDAWSAAERAATVSGRLLAFGRQQAIEPRPARVAELLRRVEAVVAPTLSSEVHLDVHIEPDLPSARMDAVWLEQSVLGILLNAREALSQGGHITVRATRLGDGDDGFVCVEVVDDGAGMSKEVLSRAFDPFFTTRSEHGTGLGLSVVHGFVEQSGGRVELESTEGVGTTVRLLVPATAPAPVLAPSRTDPGARAPSARVLLVEDQPAVQRAMQRLIESAGYSVVCAGHGEQALGRWGTEPADVVVTDVRMPHMGGVELAGELRQRGFVGPIVFVSGFPADDFERLPGLAEPWRFLAKPFRAQALLDVLQELEGPASA